MSYNLQPLITILEQILNPEETRWIVTDYNKPQLESLLQKAASLNQILEKSSVPIPESLESRIRDAAHQAEDVIERTTVNKLLSWSRPVTFSFSKKGLREVMEEFDSVMEQVVEGNSNTPKKMSTASSFSPDPPSSKNVAVVGVDEDLLLLKDQLAGYERKLEIIPITGMGGIGKTTIARNLYEDPLILSHFDVCAWTTISQDINVRAVLLGLLSRPDEKPGNELTEHTNNELKDILYKRLFGRRYFIVLDDMWSTNSWDVIRMCFPHNDNGSRIVLTTRESDVAKCVGTPSLQHKVQLLSMLESCTLLYEIVFGDKELIPRALTVIAQKIARDCGGLPLAINVIGGLLSKAVRSRAVWEHIAKDVSAAIAEGDGDGFSNILSLSYNHLPKHLQPCFLYMGAFSEDYVIEGSRLISMWVAEGFLNSKEDARKYLKALVERNLVMVKLKKYNGKACRYGMHDLLRDLCRRKAGEEKFLHVKDKATSHYLRRVSFHTPLQMEDVCYVSFARSLICTRRIMSAVIPSLLFFVLRLVRVLDVYAMEFNEFPIEILQLVNLRYLAFSLNCKSPLPREISRLFNLQTLIGRTHGGRVPSEILDMPELTHLNLDTIVIIDEGYLNRKIKEKLQKLSMVTYSPFFLKTIPNVKRLGIYFDKLQRREVVDLSHLHKLETLKCQADLSEFGCCFASDAIFPPSLRKLTLMNCMIYDRVLTILCALPNLEVLILGYCVCEDDVFEAKESHVFRSLQLLRLQDFMNMVHWRADETNFPTLRELSLLDCTALEEIPSGIGDIPTLRLIDVYDCSPCVGASAREIEKVQQDEFDNYDLKVGIYNES